MELPNHRAERKSWYPRIVHVGKLWSKSEENSDTQRVLFTPHHKALLYILSFSR